MGLGGSLFKSTMSLSGVTVLSRVLGLFREILMSQFIGGGMLMSAWSFAFQIPNMARRILGEGALGTALIPLISHTMEKEGGEAARKKFSTILIWLTFLLAALTVAVALPAIIIEPFVTEERWKLTLLALPVVMPYCILICLIGIVTSLLNALKWFALPALVSLLLNVFLIAALLLFCPGLKGNAVSIVYLLANTVLLSGFAELIVLGILLKRMNMLPTFSKITLWNTPAIKEIFKLALPGLIGMGALQVSVLSDGLIAMLISDHAKAALYYSDRLIYLPIGVFGVAFGTVSLSMMSRLAANSQLKTMLTLMFGSMRQLLFITIPLSFYFLFFGWNCLDILFCRGAFDATALNEAAVALFWYAPGIPAFAAIKITVSGYYSRKDMKTPMYVSIFCIVLNIILSLSLMIPMKQGGIALATTITSYLNCLLLLYLLRKQLGRMPLVHTAFLFLHVSGISLASAGTAWYCYLWLGNTVWADLLPKNLIPLGIATIVFGVLFMLFTLLFRIREATLVMRKLTKILKR